MHLASFYNGKRVLVTGHTGFKGSWLTLWLAKMGATVSGYALEPRTERDNYVLADVCGICESNIADIRNFERLKTAVTNFKPDIIFHLAAQPLVLESYAIPYDTFDINFRGTLNILEVFRSSETVQSLIVITTDKVYENKEWYWGYREDDRLGGKDPYSASKASSELLVHSYFESFIKDSGKHLASVRAGNVIGGGDWSEFRIVPDFFRALGAESVLEIRNPGAVRPWQFVLEPLYGYLMLGTKMSSEDLNYSGAWNFGPDKDKFKDVKSLVEMLVKLNSGSNYSVVGNSGFNKEAKFLFLDSMKAYKLLNWESKLTFEESLYLTSEWYKYYSLCNVRELCVKQLDYYESRWN